MSNPTRAFTPGSFHHIFGRGNHKDLIFRETPDRVLFLSKLEEYCDRDRQTVLAYCLMDNHYHLLLRQSKTVPLDRTMRSLLGGYVHHYNTRYGTVGSLYQGRFRSTALTDPSLDPWHVIDKSRYIHRNPVPFADFKRYRWSSFPQYMGAAGMCDTSVVMQNFSSVRSYETFCEDRVASEPVVELRKYRVVAGRRLKNDWLL